MNYHLVTSTVFDFSMFALRASKDKGPRHVIVQAADSLDAKVHQMDQASISLFDTLAGIFFGQAEHWALCRDLLSKVDSEDIVYCAGEDVGLPLAFLSKMRRSSPTVAMQIMAPDRLRTRSFIKAFGLAKKVGLFTVNDKNKYDYLTMQLGVPESNILQLPEQTDAQFFRPISGTLRGNRPLIASAGLEQRDYLTLARAIEGQDLDLKVCAFSPNASSKQHKSMPDVLPENMEVRYFEFSELRDLYCSADIVVVSLLKNNYSAGLTVLMEAMACKRPVIITRNPGLASEVVDRGFALGFEPGDVEGLRSQINFLLSNPSEAKQLSQQAHDYFLAEHTSEYHVEVLVNRLKSLETREANLVARRS